MPSYRVGGGVEGAASTVLDIVQRRQAASAEQEKQQREWNQKMREIVLSNPKSYSQQAAEAALVGKPFTGISMFPKPFTPPSGLDLYQSVDPTTGNIYRRNETQGGLLEPEPTQPAGGLSQWLSRTFGRKPSPAAISPMDRTRSPQETNLPEPSGYLEGDVIEDDSTKQQYRLVGGQWQVI